MNEHFLAAALPKREEAAQNEAFLNDLAPLLSHQMALWAGPQNTSLSVQTAERLTRSIAFTMGIEEGRPLPPAVLALGPEEALRRGREALNAEFKKAKALWQTAVQLSTGLLQNRSLKDTLAGIGAFFKQYNLLFFAQEGPAEIDYPLALPVKEEPAGVFYIARYLKELVAELSFLNRFDRRREWRLWWAFSGGPEMLSGLCLYEPVAANVLALALVGESAAGLTVPEKERERVLALLEPLPRRETLALLQGAALSVCRENGADPAEKKALCAFAKALQPRLRAALDAGNLAGVFTCFGQKTERGG